MAFRRELRELHPAFREHEELLGRVALVEEERARVELRGVGQADDAREDVAGDPLKEGHMGQSPGDLREILRVHRYRQSCHIPCGVALCAGEKMDMTQLHHMIRAGCQARPDRCSPPHSI